MIPRRAAPFAAVALLTVGMAGMFGDGGQDAPAASQTPLVLSSSLSHLTSQPVRPIGRSYEQWRAETPVTIVVEAEVAAALLDAGMPADSARALARAVVECESPVRESSGRSIGSSVTSRGDQGLSRGPFQIHVGWNPQYADTDLFDLNEGARAAVAIWRQQGLSAWACIGARP